MPVLCLQFGRFYGRAADPTARIIALVVGIGLIFNSLRGLLSGEGMYSPESRQQMVIAGWLGAVLGLGLTVWGLGMFIGFD